MDEEKNVREFFDDFAKSRNMDPDLPDSWYSITKQDILSAKGGGTILRYYSFSLRLALSSAYPAIHFDRLLFDNLPHTFWHEPVNRKMFLLAFAKSREFDPHVSAHWIKFSEEDFRKEKAGESFIRFVQRSGNSLRKIIAQAFVFDNHGHGTDVENFQEDTENAITMQKKLSEEDKRLFFQMIANTLQFDPANSENWYQHYPLLKQAVENEKDGHAVLKCHYGSISKALMATFPELHLDSTKFISVSNSKKHLHSFQGSRNFFERISGKKRFDPLDPENWYSMTTASILSEKGGQALLSSYQGSAIQALIHAFPDIPFVASKFHSLL